ncbi:hypothetical protein DFQ26_007255 [Actinomortierella ambigua]|nr:hypothetical protein DFQ26_007255 [Actinomortierella ambigua]
MAPKDFHVLIAGAGIAGLSLGVMLKKAGIQFTILEKASELKPLGSGLFLTAQVLRVYDQVGVLEDLEAVSVASHGGTYYFQNSETMADVDMSYYSTTFGYATRHVARADFVNVLMAHLPEGCIHFGKKILNTMQRAENGVMVRCADGSSYTGDILVGADGAYSAVRQSMYKNLALKGQPVPPADTAPLRLESFSILGVTKPLENEPVLYESPAKLRCLMGTREKPYIVTLLPIGKGRLAWFIRGKLLEAEFHDQESFRFTEWDNDTIHDIVKDLEHLPLVLGGTVGNLIKNTDKISRVMLEDKWFTTWYEGRTVLVGDACHKTLPAAGQGAVQSILDCVCLANLLHELPTNEASDIERVFAKFFEIRGATTAKVVATSKTISGLTSGSSWFHTFIRPFVIRLVSTPFFHSILNKSLAGRPVLNYMPKPELKGVPDPSPAHTLGLVPDAVAA